jgi:hypothetical protein
MDGGPLEDALKACGRLGIVSAGYRKVGKFGIDLFGDVMSQLSVIDAAGAHYRDGVLVFGQ